MKKTFKLNLREMKPIHSKMILTLIFICLSPFFLYSQTAERLIEDQFSIGESAQLKIDSKFTDVKIINNDEDQISIEARLWVKSDRQELAEELLQNLNVSIEKSGNEISVTTVIPEKMPSRRNTEFGIELSVYAPVYIDLDLNNKYGSAFIEEISGLAMINIEFGNLKVQELTRGKEKPYDELRLEHSKASIEEAGWLKADISYSKISIEESEALMLLTKYSGVSISEIVSLVSDSKYDTYKIDEIVNFSGEMKYANLSIGELSKKFEIKSSYSSVKVAEINADFEMITIQNSRGGYKLGIDDNASFTLMGTAERGDISINGMDNLSKRVENADKYVSGEYGEDPKSKVEIYVKEGSVKIDLD